MRLLLILKYLLWFILDHRKNECLIDDGSHENSIKRISTEFNDKNTTLRKMVWSRIIQFMTLLKYLSSNFFLIQIIDSISICRIVGLQILWPQNNHLRNVQVMLYLFEKCIQVRKYCSYDYCLLFGWWCNILHGPCQIVSICFLGVSLAQFPKLHQICRKNYLGKNYASMRRKFPQDYKFHPQTFTLPQDLKKLSNMISFLRNKKEKSRFVN